MKILFSIWMAVLTLSAVIMSAVLLSNNSRKADAAMINPQPDVTMMTTGTNGGDEGLIIIDKRAQKMIVYMLKGNAMRAVAGSRL